MKIRLSKLNEYASVSRGAYTIVESENQIVIHFNSVLEDVKEHYQSVTIRIYARKQKEYAEIYDAEIDYGENRVKKLSLESLYPWLITVDEEAWQL